MIFQAQSRPLTSQVTLTILALAIFSLAMVVGFGLFATLRADRETLEKQNIFVANGLSEAIEAVMREQESVTVWDDAVTSARTRNHQWMRQNLGAWLHSYYGHDRVYVLDEHDVAIHAMRDGATLEPSAYHQDEAEILPVVGRVRALIGSASNDNANDDPPRFAVSDMVLFDGKPAILSVAPLLSDTGRLTQQPGTEYIHVSVQFIDSHVIDEIASQYLLRDVSLVQGSGPLRGASVPLTDSQGATLGLITWDPDRPGETMIRDASPALVLGALLAAGVVVFLLRRLRRVSSLVQQSQDQAQYLAFHDTLTGLPNRALFEDRLKHALVTVRRDKRKIALLYLDLDRFKNVNDTLGHSAGDELVRQTATRLQSCLRDVDTVARLGGDEFAIILTDIRGGGIAEDLCKRLLHKLSQPFSLLDDQVFVGASIGLALAPEFGIEPADLMRKADIALYEAKKNGRGRYEIFAGDMDDLLLRKRLIESELRLALVNDSQIKLLYQPIYAADCSTILGAEALIRWEHPVHGALSPQHFITIAEERGMIGQLGDWVLREATRFAATTDLPWVAVNVSPLQLRDEGFTAHVLGILAETGLPPQRLEIEITEGVLLENSDVSKSVLASLRAAGIRIALDDFGTGYSSINYLRRYAIDKLKVDRSFVRLLGDSQESVAIVKALVDLASAMKVQVTAEGVETAEQRDLLIGMGCNELQGFLFSPPLAAAAMHRLSASRLPAQPVGNASS